MRLIQVFSPSGAHASWDYDIRFTSKAKQGFIRLKSDVFRLFCPLRILVAHTSFRVAFRLIHSICIRTCYEQQCPKWLWSRSSRVLSLRAKFLLRTYFWYPTVPEWVGKPPMDRKCLVWGCVCSSRASYYREMRWLDITVIFEDFFLSRFTFGNHTTSFHFWIWVRE